MAQANPMGPPTSSKEPRRSGRRSQPSTSTSKSSESPSPDTTMQPQQKISEATTAVRFSSATSARSKRSKEDGEEQQDDQIKNTLITNGSAKGTSTVNSRRTQRKGKERSYKVDAYSESDPALNSTEAQLDASEKAEEDEDAGITRCVCEARAEDDTEAEGFMIQCELCKVWQHGRCMGFPTEDDIPEGDYYCEDCRPELHLELLKRLSKKHRQGSAQSSFHGPSRLSRSHSPSHLLKPAKRRNTMNSRDAAYEESLQEVLGASAAEAAALAESSTKEPEMVTDMRDEALSGNPRKKRKRSDGDQPNVKRKRSTSTTPEIPHPPSIPEPLLEASERTVQPPLKANSSRTKRNNGRKNVAESINGDNDEGNNLKKHPNQYTYRGLNGTHEHGTRRNAGGGAVMTTMSASQLSGLSNSGPSRNPYHNPTQQQPFYTSWNLPDYLNHLQSILPSDTPAPLVICTSTTAADPELATSTERGVRVKWPAKRMSVADMNKRVRALVEWVGREQASALEREKRKKALESSMASERENIESINIVGDPEFTPLTATDDSRHSAEAKHSETSSINEVEAKGPIATNLMQSNETIMEELMEELISFQERFGPGAKNRSRDRNTRVVTGNTNSQ